MENEFIPYEQALALKELGFDEKCFATYRTNAVGSKKPFEHDLDYHTKVEMSSNVIPINSEYTEESKWISAPLYQQAFRWFRDEYNLKGFIGFRPNTKQFDFHVYDMSLSRKEYVKQRTMEEFNKDPKVGTYEEAELACLNKLIQTVKNGE